MLKIVSAVFLVISYMAVFIGCASMDRNTANDNAYLSSVKQYSDRAEFYSGFINVFQMQGTVLNSKILAGQAQKKADSFNWTDAQIAEEAAKNDKSLRAETVVFLSFFSPEMRVNNLDSPSSIWRVFIDVNNKRYVGSASTYVGFQNEAGLFYPYHSVFGKAYLVKFPVPMINIQDYPIKLTVTGTIGSDTIEFPALK